MANNYPRIRYTIAVQALLNHELFKGRSKKILQTTIKHLRTNSATSKQSDWLHTQFVFYGICKVTEDVLGKRIRMKRDQFLAFKEAFPPSDQSLLNPYSIPTQSLTNPYSIPNQSLLNPYSIPTNAQKTPAFIETESPVQHATTRLITKEYLSESAITSSVSDGCSSTEEQVPLSTSSQVEPIATYVASAMPSPMGVASPLRAAKDILSRISSLSSSSSPSGFLSTPSERSNGAIPGMGEPEDEMPDYDEITDYEEIEDQQHNYNEEIKHTLITLGTDLSIFKRPPRQSIGK